MRTYLLFKDGKLVTVVQTKANNIALVQIRNMLIDYDYLVEDPQDADKQIEEWKK